jgi:CBS domain-containing protein
MTHLLIVILGDLQCLPTLLQAWQTIGVPGVTIVESAGGYRTTTWLSRVGLGALSRLFEAEEVHTRTLLAAIEDEELLARAVAEAERVMGGFDRPDSGLLLVLPVAQVIGLHKVRPKPPQEALPPAVRPDWMVRRDTPVEKMAAILNLEPIVVRPDTPLDEVARAMLTRPSVYVACVVTEDGRLVGLLDLQALADDLFFHILPEEFLSEVTDLERVMQFAEKSRIRTAADAMQEAVWVKRGETVKEAFRRMHEHRLSGLPVVDERYHVTGYINLLELLTVCLERECLEEEVATNVEATL